MSGSGNLAAARRLNRRITPHKPCNLRQFVLTIGQEENRLTETQAQIVPFCQTLGHPGRAHTPSEAVPGARARPVGCRRHPIAPVHSRRIR